MDDVRNAAINIGASQYIDVIGYGCKPGFIFKDESGNASMVARTLFLQETIARGLLMPYVVPSLAHTEETINFAVTCITAALRKMKEAAETEGMQKALLDKSVVKPVFRKFN
jgi:glutamate-1-semialdehyde 2,1-aminomutase